MDAELERRWKEAERQKNIAPDELKATVQEMERGITIPENWDQRVLAPIRKEKAEAEKRYGIRIGQTDIYCAWCGKPAGFFHICAKMDPKRRREIETLQEELTRPITLKSLSEWREKMGIQVGMSKDEAVDRFIEWRASKKTCERCEGDKYIEYCPVHLICKEADEYERNATRNDNGSGVTEAVKFKAIRADISQERKRSSLRPNVGSETGVPRRRSHGMVSEPSNEV